MPEPARQECLPGAIAKSLSGAVETMRFTAEIARELVFQEGGRDSAVNTAANGVDNLTVSAESSLGLTPRSKLLAAGALTR